MVIREPTSPPVGVPGNDHAGRRWARLRVPLLGTFAVLILGISLIIATDSGEPPPPPPPPPVVVQGVVGLARAPFFEDPTVIERFAANKLQVNVITSGSRAMARMDLSKIDFAIPGDTLPAKYIISNLKSDNPDDPRMKNIQTHPLYPSPIVVASFRSIAEKLMLTGEGVTTPVVTPMHGSNQYYRFDMAAYLDMVKQEKLWSGLPGGDYEHSTSVLIYTTSPCDSNSAGMYIAITSYLFNGRKIITDREQNFVQEINLVSRQIFPLFDRQGIMPDTTGKLFEKYRTQGRDTVPLALIYEYEFLRQKTLGDGSITEDMVLLYPDPGIIAGAELVAIPRADGNNYGDQVGKLLRNDDVLRRRAAEFGYHVDSGEVTKRYLQDRGIALPPGLGGPELNRANINPPSPEVLNPIIQQVGNCPEPAK